MNTHVFLINLDRHKTKYNNSMKILKSIGLNNIERISAVDGRKINLKDIDLTWYTKFLLRKPNYRCAHEQLNTRGAIGCYLSHMKCWETLVKNGYDNAFIFEDDLNILKNFLYEFNQLMIPSDCDLLSFGYIDGTNKVKVNDQFLKCDTFMGTQGYFITSKGAEKLLKYAFPMETQIDAYISLMNYFKKINLYLTIKTMVTQKNITGSSINYIDCYKCHLPNIPSYTLTPYVFIILIILVILILLLLIRIKIIK